MKEVKYFTVLDLKNGYFQIPLREGDEEETAFVVPWGKFDWLRMPQGSLGAPFTFGENIASIFNGMEGYVAAYFDDLAIYNDTAEEHLQSIKKVLDRLASYELRLNLTTCQWMKQEVQFLGHEISSEGIRPLTSKINEIVSISVPSGVDQLRAFLGLCAYYRKFVPNFSDIAAPLYDLLKKNKSFIWSDDCEAAFAKLKQSLSEPSMLAFPDSRSHLLYRLML